MMNHFIMIGFMGAGKTTIGRALAGRLSREIVDTDQLIEEKAGMIINDIFEKKGEEAFRLMETEVLKDLKEYETPVVISVGGGLPLREENRVLLKELGTVVYLRVKAETVLKRLKGDTTRPLLKGDNVKEKVDSLLSYREPFYEDASHVIVDVDGKTADEIVDEILKTKMGRCEA